MKIPILCTKCHVEYLGDEREAEDLTEPLCNECKGDGAFLDNLL